MGIKRGARRGLARLVPQSLLSRMVIVLVIAVLAAQALSSLIWVAQIKTRNQENVLSMSNHLAFSIASTVRFFKSLPVEYRHIVLDQLRRMGGSRFFVTFNSELINISPTPDADLKRWVLEEVDSVLQRELGRQVEIISEFSFAESLHVFNNDIRLLDLPPGWGHHSLLLHPQKTPILVVQIGLEKDEWLYLATLLPTPDGLIEGDYLPAERLWFMGITVVLVVLSLFVVVRWLTRPLKLLSRAADELGKDIERPPLPEEGSTEVVAAARTFNAMQERIQRYIQDRETLFSAISHDLKTPITRLRLRAEMLDDDQLRGKFIQDLEDLDHMVHGALQCVKDTTVHENPVNIDLHYLLQQICEGADLQRKKVVLTGVLEQPFWGKPLALKRAFSNIIDNALFYGHQAEVFLEDVNEGVHVAVRDFGPGVPEMEQDRIFEPYVRLEKSRNRNTGGSGLGLSIARNIIHAHGGRLKVRNHEQGGFVVEVWLPRQYQEV
ncbi:HAMP domain-containing protein [Hahella sp. KA22]|uniref:ATP-binding protein n=1 Tax=Hahella sp. KA22 TaxID=1628392 RepID=UPI000FDE7859|nr:ATP-binding protein [Hahella sp. KA22]AZZ94498.1 HAMP domain-containing protein [Hahella sp. KA22]QAY57871.1 HAMP domain-containing protein [Hahella sp. KA22]